MMEKFKALAWHFQLLVLVGIAAVVYSGVWYFFTSVTRAETQVLTDQVTQLKQQNETARIATERIDEFRTLYATKAQEYDELKVLLPEQREITNVLQGLQDTAGESHLIVMRFSPLDDVQEDAMMKKPVQVEIDTNFNNLRDFFDKMAKLQRIVSITDFKLNQIDKQTSDRTLHAQFVLTAYYASPDNLNATNKPVVPGQPTPAGQQPVATQPVPNQPVPVAK